MNEKLSRLGWSAVSVRGFIPPAVFTELQAMRVLAIAADIRTHEHIEYTPAPDIVHESAGHARSWPTRLTPPSCSARARSASAPSPRVEDQEVYEAIRALSVAKEDPSASAAESRAPSAGSRRPPRPAASSPSRRAPRASTGGRRSTASSAPSTTRSIYGAGLLTSIGESTHCFSDEVETLPLSAAAAEVEFDITRMQPQLFVAREFGQLSEVVDELGRTLASAAAATTASARRSVRAP